MLDWLASCAVSDFRLRIRSVSKGEVSSLQLQNNKRIVVRPWPIREIPKQGGCDTTAACKMLQFDFTRDTPAVGLPVAGGRKNAFRAVVHRCSEAGWWASRHLNTWHHSYQCIACGNASKPKLSHGSRQRGASSRQTPMCCVAVSHRQLRDELCIHTAVQSVLVLPEISRSAGLRCV